MLTRPSRHRCAVWGSPIEHSLSPVLHRAAYAALGLTDWSYERREVDEAGFPAAFAALGPEWRGLSLTMPLKEIAATVAHAVSDTARETGAVNTLVRDRHGWAAHNTDVHGVTAALAEAGCSRPETALVIGSGATARSALHALAGLGVRRVSLMVRSEPRPATLAQAARAGLAVDVVPMGGWPAADVVVSTVPPTALDVDRLPHASSPRSAVLDVVYGQGRTPLQRLAERRGWAVAEGTAMLLHQAARQVELMTGRPAPVGAMRAALTAAVGGPG